MEALFKIINILGGLGLFLYGINMMGDSLENVFGNKLKSIIDKLSTNPIKSVFIGTIVTAIIQSSSATTVMVVGFVNAGLMNLYQAAAIIMGANIGTTITAQIITFEFNDFSSLFLAIGTCMVVFAKKKKTKEIGRIILGFGILFLGLNLMSSSMISLKKSDIFNNLVLVLEGHMILGVFIGAVMTAILQSSSASIGILVALAKVGSLPLSVAIPILLGNNIGTCITALISSIGTAKTAKKAALLHLIIKVVGTIICLIIPISIITKVILLVSPTSGELAVPKQIANAHTLFNVVNTIILLPFIKYLVAFVNTLIPGEDEKDLEGLMYIDDRLLETPTIAFGQTINEIIRMANKSKENLELSMKAFEASDERLVEKVYENEKKINLLEHDITRFLVKLSNSELNESQKNNIATYFHVINDIERIGDHAENIADLTSERITKELEMSMEAMNELKNMFEQTIKVLEMSIDCFEEYDKTKFNSISKIEEKIDSLEKELKTSHIRRLNSGICDAVVGAIFLELIGNLERVGDHSMNIAEMISI